MRRSDPILISPGFDPGQISGPRDRRRTGRLRLRAFVVIAGVCAGFLMVAGQLVRLALSGQTETQASISRPLATAYSRPDIVDRNGRLLATDVVMPSLFADPQRLLDLDETVDALRAILPDVQPESLREQLEDRRRRFVWIKRGLSPSVAQQIHELGLPGLGFRDELRRAYPGGRTAGHVIGAVNVDNKGLSGLELYLDENDLAEPVHAAVQNQRKPVRLSLDLGVQFALDDELRAAMSTYKAEAAAGLLMDLRSGELIAATSLPGVDPQEPLQAADPARLNRLMTGAYELGSVFKILTVGMALEDGMVTPQTLVDVTRPLEADGHVIADPHPVSRPISVSDIFVKSSNVGAGVLALSGGPKRQRAFYESLGLLERADVDGMALARPRLPERWGAIETVTASYGHGLAVSPLQFALAVGRLIGPRSDLMASYLRGGNGAAFSCPHSDGATGGGQTRCGVSQRTKTALRAMMARNVAERGGTGWRARVPGLAIGGKTGTAEIAVGGRYRDKKVISSFVAAFPIDAPRYLTLVTLFEPRPVPASGHAVTAGRTAAPVTGRFVRRVAPMLGL